jgi:hypothetical protein
MTGAVPPLSQYVFMAWYLVKYRDDFTFTCQFIVTLTFQYVRPKQTVTDFEMCKSDASHLN